MNELGVKFDVAKLEWLVKRIVGQNRVGIIGHCTQMEVVTSAPMDVSRVER